MTVSFGLLQEANTEIQELLKTKDRNSATPKKVEEIWEKIGAEARKDVSELIQSVEVVLVKKEVINEIKTKTNEKECDAIIKKLDKLDVKLPKIYEKLEDKEILGYLLVSMTNDEKLSVLGDVIQDIEAITKKYGSVADALKWKRSE